MRVVQLLPELNEGGVERGVVELNRELVRRSIESVVISAGGRQVEQVETDGGVHLRLDVASKNLLTAWPRMRMLRNQFDRLQPDIIHVRSRVPAWLAFLANRHKRPFVTTVHGFNSVNAYSRIMTRGDRVIVVSRAIGDFVRQHYAVADEKLRLIPRGIDLEQFDPHRLDREFMQRFSAEHGLRGRLIVTTVGRITQLKDLETFIKAIDRVRADQPEVLGLIVGGVHPDRQSYFAALQKQVAAVNLDDHIRFVGSQHHVAEIYALSRVVVSSSKKPESFGRSAAEALAMGVPVIGTGHGGMLDIVIDGETGYLFSPGQATQLAEKITLAAERSWPNLREHVARHFSLEQMVEKTLAVYRELVP